MRKCWQYLLGQSDVCILDHSFIPRSHIGYFYPRDEGKIRVRWGGVWEKRLSCVQLLFTVKRLWLLYRPWDLGRKQNQSASISSASFREQVVQDDFPPSDEARVFRTWPWDLLLFLVVFSFSGCPERRHWEFKTWAEGEDLASLMVFIIWGKLVWVGPLVWKKEHSGVTS